MKLLEIGLLIVLIVIVVNMNIDTIPEIKNTHRPSSKTLPIYNEDILIENRGPPVKTMGDFPIPQSTTISKSLSSHYPENLSLINQGTTIPNKDVVFEHRSNKHSTQESHFPKYYRKDNMSGSTIGSSEYKFAEVDNQKSSHAWSDENVSQYPNFYTSQIKGGLTNPGDFFDINNNFVDTTKPRSTANVGDICYVSKDGEKVCLDNTRLQNIPPSLITNKSNCGFLNSIGLLEFSNLIYEDKERVNNGGFLYGTVKGSKKHNETYSEPIQAQNLSCQV